MATFAEELDEDLIREARANSQHLPGTPMAHAFKNYGADRAKQAKDAALQAPVLLKNDAGTLPLHMTLMGGSPLEVAAAASGSLPALALAKNFPRY